MSDKAIIVEGLSKRYELGLINSGTLSNDLKIWWSKWRGREDPRQIIGQSSIEKEYWALKDLHFEIKKGDSVGIIGKNGAGKSTLLKILSRVTAPTKGNICINGRIASLLEVGTGFHPELTGRENIFMNGAILGMSAREIKNSLDEIISFSGVEQHIDTPVKRYSSGMYVRLAFAVAAHLEPEILVVDEVLAVGDAEFQKKCLGKMNDVANQGRTVLFVSHQLYSIQQLCKTGIYLNKGTLVTHSDVQKALQTYLEDTNISDSVFQIALTQQDHQNPGYAYKVQIEDLQGQLLPEIAIGIPWQARISVKINTFTEHFILGFGIQSGIGFPIVTSWTKPKDTEPGEYEIVFKCDQLLLTSGQYKLVIGLSRQKHTFQYLDNDLFISISEATHIDSIKDRVVNTQSGILVNQLDYEITTL